MNLYEFKLSSEASKVLAEKNNKQEGLLFWHFIIKRKFPNYFRLTFSSLVSLTIFSLCVQVKLGGGIPLTSHSNFIFCPALAITFVSGSVKAGDSVGSIAAQPKETEKGQKKCYHDATIVRNAYLILNHP